MTTEPPPHHHRRRGGVPSAGNSRLPSPGPGNSVPGGLGGVRPGGAVLGQRRGHSGSLSHH